MGKRYFYDQKTGIWMMLPDTCSMPRDMVEVNRQTYYEELDREIQRRDCEREIYKQCDEEDRKAQAKEQRRD